jgi:hypothetical protein
MMVVRLGRLAPYQGVARDERPQRGSGFSGWRTNNGKERNTETEKYRPRNEEKVIHR